MKESIKNIEDADWNVLLKTIRDNKCTLMIGPNIPIKFEKNESKSVTDVLKDMLAEGIHFEQANSCNFFQVAERYFHEEGANVLNDAVEEFCEKIKSVDSEIYTALSSIPFSNIITTAYDDIFFETLQRIGKTPSYHFYDVEADATPLTDKGTAESPLFYKLYGSVKNTSSFVLTESQYLNFVFSIISDSLRLPYNIKNLLEEKNRSFLFLGFKFDNWYLRLLLYLINNDGNGIKNRSFAFESTLSKCDPHTIFFYQNTYKIALFSLDVAEFVSELKRRYDKINQINEMPQNQKLSQNHKIKVFISYASENAVVARKISDELSAQNIDVWLDKSNLRAGDEFNPLIEKVIKSEVDYFVVLLSDALYKKPESFVNREIKIAFTRQGDLASGFKFIFPIKIEECKIRYEFESTYHYHDFAAHGLRDVVPSILEDFQKRKDIKNGK